MTVLQSFYSLEIVVQFVFFFTIVIVCFCYLSQHKSSYLTQMKFTILINLEYHTIYSPHVEITTINQMHNRHLGFYHIHCFLKVFLLTYFVSVCISHILTMHKALKLCPPS